MRGVGHARGVSVTAIAELGSKMAQPCVVPREVVVTGGGPIMGGHASIVGAQTSIPPGRDVIPCVAYLAVISVRAKANPLTRLKFPGAVSS